MNHIYSYHTFMFPFSFDKAVEVDKEQNEHICFEKRVKIDKELDKKLKEHGWIYTPFIVDECVENYNEYVYFYEYARDVLYNKDENFTEGRSVYFYKKKYQKGTITFGARRDKKTYEYKLDVDGISLKIFDTGVAILSLSIKNSRYKKFEDILIINDFLRRTYPQFLSKDTVYTKRTKEAFLPTFVELELDKHYREDFEEHYIDNIPKQIILSKIIREILDENLFSPLYKQGTYHIKPIIDDRMFVISWFGDSELSEKLTTWDEKEEKYSYEKSDEWYRYVFLDSIELRNQSRHLKKKLIEESTYDRWVEKGSLFGVTKNSFVCLSENSNFAREVIPLPHLKSMYYQLYNLILAQRASILRFSDEISMLSSFSDDTLEKLVEKTSQVYKHYIKFINKLYIRDITAQDQGIEIYKKAQVIFNIHYEIKDLDEEIEELHNYIDIKEEKYRNERLEKISIIGAVLLPPSLVTGFFGVNSITFSEDIPMTISVLLCSAFFGYHFLKKYIKSSHPLKK